MFHYTATSEKSIDDVVQSIEESLKNHKFGVLWQLDIPEKLKEKGVELNQPYRVLEVCNPHEAKEVLSKNLLVGYFLPCKIVVYENDGKTQIGLPKPSMLMEMIGDNELFETAQRVEKALIQAIDDAVQ